MSFVGIMAYHLFYSQRAERKNRMNGNTYEPLPLGEVITETPHDGSINATTSSSSNSFNPTLAASNTRPYSPVLGKLFWLAIGGYFGGFVFWLYENTFCTTLPSWMQLHAVWHIMAGLGSFCTVQCQLAWRSEELGGRTYLDWELGWGFMPIVIVKYTQSE